MKFIVDAQLPRSLARFLSERGFDSIHTSELPLGNDTSDNEINRISFAENRVVISKDGDFYDSYTASHEPYKLLHVRTGNISNRELLILFERNLGTIISELETGTVVFVTHHYVGTLR